MDRNERLQEILKILEQEQFATVDYLSLKLHISASSVRRDVATLEAQGLISRIHGGLSLAVKSNLDIPFRSRMKAQVNEKKRIAASALRLVKDGDVIFIDSSSTCMYLLRELSKRKSITVVTNGVYTLQQLAETKVTVISTGGALDPRDRAALIGSEALEILSNIRANVCFFSVQALDDEGNMSDCYREETAITRQMIKNASLKVCLADGSKIGKSSTFKTASLADIDILVCELPLESKYRCKFPDLKIIHA